MCRGPYYPNPRHYHRFLWHHGFCNETIINECVGNGDWNETYTFATSAPASIKPPIALPASMTWSTVLLPVAVPLDGPRFVPDVSAPGLVGLPTVAGLTGLTGLAALGLGLEGLMGRRARMFAGAPTPRSVELGWLGRKIIDQRRLLAERMQTYTAVSACTPKERNPGPSLKGENGSCVPTDGKRNRALIPAVVGVGMALEQYPGEFAQGDGCCGVWIGAARPGEGRAARARARGARGTNERIVSTSRNR